MTLWDHLAMLALIAIVIGVTYWASKRGDDTDGDGPY